MTAVCSAPSFFTVDEGRPTAVIGAAPGDGR